jgi:hypothetical protein
MFSVKYFLGVYPLILFSESSANCLIQLMDIAPVLENLDFRCLNRYSLMDKIFEFFPLLRE